MERTIRIKVGTKSSLINLTTSVSTVGELKKLTSDINWKNTVIVDKDTKNSLVLDNALLPATNCTLFVLPQKSKAGYTYLGYKEAKAKIKELKEKGVEIPFNYTQATTAAMNEFLEGREEVDMPESQTLHLKPGKYVIIVEGGTEVVEKIIIPEGYIDMTLLVDCTTLKDLDNEYDEIAKQV
ncbi:MAG: hypothetical protein EOL97_09015 [Spirochaetia bacterium]|nr:hypothetical protein [Spirochaetia bacterium]